jgi:hypothetical protein
MFLKVLWFGLAAIATMMATSAIARKRQRTKLVATLREDWGRWRERDRDLQAIAGYHRALVANGEAAGALDDRTWDDLNFDGVFTFLDRTQSVIGQQLLYHRLRGAPMSRSLESFEALVTRMSAEAATREDAQLALAKLRDAGGYDLWFIAQPGTVTAEPWYVIFPMMAASMVISIAAVPFFPPAMLMLLVGAVGSIGLRMAVAKRLQVAVGAYRQIGPLLVAAGALQSAGQSGGPLVSVSFGQDVTRLSTLKRIAAWVGRDAAAATAGNLASLVIEYLNLLFCLDANALFFGARELRRCGPELLRVLAELGDIDSAVSVASYRSNTTGWTRPSFQPVGQSISSRAVMTSLRHPLLPDAVANSVTLGPPNGVIITGSNMSGKTTFLRTVGVTAVLAQTINTVLAEAYEAPVFVVQSCIGRADDPSTGKSYYLVEVESVLSLVHAAESDAPHLFLFDELFRGTNAVERIAAGEAVLLSLLTPRADGSPAPHLVLAATHDQELVDLLGDRYASFHFTDTIDDSGLSFDYRLLPGAATTRNAIALLRLRGAPASLVQHALDRAADLDRVRRHNGAPGL